MCLRKLENSIKQHANERDTNGQLGLVPFDIYDCLEEALPHGLVVKLGEMIMRLKGVGSDPID